jgi:exodeoxyribonuclease III
MEDSGILNLKIATFNCNSVRSRLPIVLEWLTRESPDLLALQETKVTDDQFPREAFESAGWRLAVRGQKAYNGVAFVTKKPLEDVVGSPPEEEARLIMGRLDGVLFINTYVPQGTMPDSPKFEKKLRFLADLKTRLAEIAASGTPAVWMGDLNVAPTEEDLWDPKGNAEHVCFHPKVRRAFEAARGTAWADLFREKVKGPGHFTFWDYLVPTNLARNRGWRVDHLLGTAPMVKRLRRVWIDKEPRLKEKPSDHTFLAAEFE